MGTLIHASTCNETLILVDVIQICVSRSAKSSFIKVLGNPYTTHMTLRYPGHPALTNCSNPKPIGSRRNRDVPHNFSATHFSSDSSGREAVPMTLRHCGRADLLVQIDYVVGVPSKSRRRRGTSDCLLQTVSVCRPLHLKETILLRIRKDFAKKRSCAAELPEIPAAHFYRNFQPLRLTSLHMK